MDEIFKKLNYKDQSQVVILNSPSSFENHIQNLGKILVARHLGAVEKTAFFMAFVKSQIEIDTIAKEMIPKLDADAIIWFCYPKGTS